MGFCDASNDENSFLALGDVSERTYASQPNTEVLQWVPEDAGQVLDLGCGSGANAAMLSRRGIHVDGVTLSEEEAKQASLHCRQVFVHNLERGLPPGIGGPYDAVLCSHVLEHICFPSQLLHDIVGCLAPGGRTIVAVPNLLFYRTRLQLLLGRFEYSESGIMDSTHFRWYTLSSLSRLLERHGLSPDTAYGDGNVPMGRLRRIAPGACARLDRLACARFPGLFGLQLLAVATVKRRGAAGA
jgi:SAM-dependent methyltransferase